MTRSVFVCYRRKDTEDAAGRLFDRLSAAYPNARVFMDIDSVPLGIDFVEHVAEQIANCNAVIVMIGERWLTVKDTKRRRRLDDPDDLVRVEIRAALSRKIPVIPVIVQNASMPHAEDLPEDIRPLSRRNGIQLRAEQWRDGVERLLRELSGHLEGDTASEAASSPLTPTDAPSGLAENETSLESVSEPSNRGEARVRGMVGMATLDELIQDDRAGLEPANKTEGGVFVSCASEDYDKATRIKDALEREGLPVWLRTQTPGSEYPDSVAATIRSCALFVAVLSSRSLPQHSNYLWREWHVAEQTMMSLPIGIPFIIPVLIDEVSWSDHRLPEFLRSLNWIIAPEGVLSPESVALFKNAFRSKLRHSRG